MLHRDNFQKHKPIVFVTFIAQGKLWRYLADVDAQTQQMFDTLVKHMKEKECVTEKLKEDNHMLWTKMINNIQNRANEIVCKKTDF